MPTLKTGVWSRDRLQLASKRGGATPGKSRRRNDACHGGFTLIELMVILVILGTVALVVIPRVGSFSAGELKRTSRHLTSVISHLTQESASTKKVYRLYFNLDSDDYWVSDVHGSGERVTLKENQTIKRKHLPDRITFEDVVTARQGKVTEGEIFAEIYPVGVEAMAIHLIEEGGEGVETRRFTLLVNPLTGRVKAFDYYVDSIE